jgi:transposase, IS5 family
MKKPSPTSNQPSFLFADLLDQLNPKHPLLLLAKQLPWDFLEQEFSPLYAAVGRPAKPIRLMVGLCLLKHMENLSDEAVVRNWVQNPYYQAFCGETEFQWQFPCDPTDLIYFRKRIGAAGFEKILAASIALHGAAVLEDEVCVDTTVQEKNITFPTDAKLYRKIIVRCWRIAHEHGIALSRTYAKEVKQRRLELRFGQHPKKRVIARKAQQRLKTIAGRLLREIQRKLPADVLVHYAEDFALYQRVLNQKRADKNKIYSLHEPHVYCMSKNKEHKRYEFGTKVSITTTRDSKIILGALAFDSNVYDGHTLPAVIDQIKRLLGRVPSVAITDRGYRGRKKVGETKIVTPCTAPNIQDDKLREEARRRFRLRAGIEPVIGHLKSDHRLKRNFLKGFVGDQINVLLAAAAFNLRKWIRLIVFCFYWLRSILKITPELSALPV